ncbi:MAG: autotransporter-associated beta strand repeat-containing protein [Alcaligenes sp.]
MQEQYGRGKKERVGLASRGAMFVAAFGLMAYESQFVLAQTAEPVSVPLMHVSTDNDDSYDALGIMIGVDGSTPRLFQFDTGSDDFMAPFDANAAGIKPVPGEKPKMVAYGDGSYGYWTQRVKFGELHYHDPKRPSQGPVASTAGDFAAGRILDWVFTRDHYGFKEHKTSASPVGYDDETPLYADLEVRERIRTGKPTDNPPFYGTYGAGDFKMSEGPSASLGSQTRTGYVIAANANVGKEKTPGCAPCLVLHLNPSIRSQFTAVMPWGELPYDDEGYDRRFDQSGANASNQHEGAYSYTISFKVGKKKRAVEFKGPILFDTGTSDFIYVEQDKVLKMLKAKGFKLGEHESDTVDFKLHGFADKLNDVEFDDVEISRIRDEDEGDGVTIGLPFFQSNSLMYDLQNKATAYSPYFVTIQDFTTNGPVDSAGHLSRITGETGSSGWIGLAGRLSGSGDFVLEKDTNVRMTGINDYTGATHVKADSHLHLAGQGSLEQSSRVVVDGALYIDQKGGYMAAWRVPDMTSDTRLRSIEGGKAGSIFLGRHKLVLTAANGRFDGSIFDYDDRGKNLGGSLVLESGRLVLGGDNDYSGTTEVASGAELHVAGSLTGNVSVFGALVVDGQIDGTVTVQDGGRLSGQGKVGDVQVLSGGTAAEMKKLAAG